MGSGPCSLRRGDKLRNVSKRSPFVRTSGGKLPRMLGMSRAAHLRGDTESNACAQY
jgi:hypothetical protein